MLRVPLKASRSPNSRLRAAGAMTSGCTGFSTSTPISISSPTISVTHSDRDAEGAVEGQPVAEFPLESGGVHDLGLHRVEYVHADLNQLAHDLRHAAIGVIEPQEVRLDLAGGPDD